MMLAEEQKEYDLKTPNSKANQLAHIQLIFSNGIRETQREKEDIFK